MLQLDCGQQKKVSNACTAHTHILISSCWVLLAFFLLLFAILSVPVKACCVLLLFIHLCLAGHTWCYRSLSHVQASAAHEDWHLVNAGSSNQNLGSCCLYCDAKVYTSVNGGHARTQALFLTFSMKHLLIPACIWNINWLDLHLSGTFLCWLAAMIPAIIAPHRIKQTLHFMHI